MKKIGLLLLALFFTVGLAGCSTKDADPVGTWSMTGDWECDDHLFHSGTWHIYPDGTFFDSMPSSFNGVVEETGSWKVDGDSFTLTYASGMKQYVGSVDEGYMNGTCSITQSGSSETGCWSATRTDSAP